LLEIQAPLDWNKVGEQTWGEVLSAARARGLLSASRSWRQASWQEEANQVLRVIRQPDWWQGDAQYHPAMPSNPSSKLHVALARGEFVITAELSPPKGTQQKDIYTKAARMRDLIHAANVTQNPMATARMSSLACSVLLARQGIEPIMQLTARDFNRLALQSETIGASALGIHNILCLTGDPPTGGHSPAGNLPYDLDATQMLWILRRMRDEGRFLDGQELPLSPEFFLGAAGSPNDSNLKHEALRLEKKINAGAQFIQTQLVYDIEQLERWLEALDARDLLAKAFILVGIGPLRSIKVAKYLQDHIPDVDIPHSIVKRLAYSDQPEETGQQIALELVEKVRSISAISGIHLMSVGWEKILPLLLSEITQEAANASL
jgi:methylenetetrahydrofolate reductase (NADPH)